MHRTPPVGLGVGARLHRDSIIRGCPHALLCLCVKELSDLARMISIPRCMQVGPLLCAAGVLALWPATSGCRPDVQRLAESATTLTWVGRDGGFSAWGCAGSYVYGKSVKPAVLDVFVWSGETLKKRNEVALPACVAVSWTEKGDCLFNPLGKSRSSETIVLLKAGGNATTSRWPVPGGWDCLQTQPSENGRYVGACLSEDPGEPAADYAWDVDRAMIGLLTPDEEDIQWVRLQGRKGQAISGDIRSVRPSNDGKYVAVGGWDCGVAMIDVAAQSVLWSRRPPRETCAYYVAFAPDASVVYAGGTDGIVYVMDVRTGNVLGQWCASPSGKAEYGHRISSLAVSPDGRWVAAGTGPEGLLFVGSATLHKVVAVLDHGGSTVLLVHFSPDSSALASFVPGTLKVWKVSQWAKGIPPGDDN